MQPAAATLTQPKRKKLLGRQLPVPQQCPNCPTKCRSPWALRMHLLQHFRSSTKSRLNCSQCTERFNTLLAKSAHIQLVHRDGVNFVGEDCTICTASCRGSYRLRKYFLDHERHRKCAKCGDWWPDFNKLRRHEQTCGTPAPEATTQSDVVGLVTANMEFALPNEERAVG